MPIAVPGLSLSFPAAHYWWSAGCGGRLSSALEHSPVPSAPLLHSWDSSLPFLWEEGFCLVLGVIAHPLIPLPNSLARVFFKPS